MSTTTGRLLPSSASAYRCVRSLAIIRRLQPTRNGSSNRESERNLFESTCSRPSCGNTNCHSAELKTNCATQSSSSSSCDLCYNHRNSASISLNHTTPDTRTSFTSAMLPSLPVVNSVVANNNSGVAVWLANSSKFIRNGCPSSHTSAGRLVPLARLTGFPRAAAAAVAPAVSTRRKAAASIPQAREGLRCGKSVRSEMRSSSSVVLALSTLHSLCFCTGAALLPPTSVGSPAEVVAHGGAAQPALPTTLPSLQHSNASHSLHAVPAIRRVQSRPGAAAVTDSTATLGEWRSSYSRLQAVSLQNDRRRSHSVNSGSTDSNGSASCCASESAKKKTGTPGEGALLRGGVSPLYTGRKASSFDRNTTTGVHPEQNGVPAAQNGENKQRKNVNQGVSMLWFGASSKIPRAKRGKSASTRPAATPTGATAETASFQPGGASLPSSVARPPVAGGTRWPRTPAVVGSVAAASKEIRAPGVAARELSAAARTYSAAAEDTARVGEELLLSSIVAVNAAAGVHPGAGRRGKISSHRGVPSVSTGVLGIVNIANVYSTDSAISRSFVGDHEAAGNGEIKPISDSSGKGEASGKGEEGRDNSAPRSQTSLQEGATKHPEPVYQDELSHPERLRAHENGRGEAANEEEVRAIGEERTGEEPGFLRPRSKSASDTDALYIHADDEELPDEKTLLAAAAAEADFDGEPGVGEGMAVGAAVAAFIEQNREAVESGEVKLLLLMRHAQSEYNKWRTESVLKPSEWRYDQGIRDVGLSELGVQQCFRARQELLSVAMALPPDMAIDLHLTSPLLRAVQTAVTSFPCPQASMKKSHLAPAEADADLFPPRGSSPEEIARRAEVVERIRPAMWILTPLLRERVDTLADVGSEKKQLLLRIEELEGKQTLPPGCSCISCGLDASLLPPVSVEAHDQCSSWCLEMTTGEVSRVKREMRMSWTNGTDTSGQSKGAVAPVDKETLQQKVLQALMGVHDFSEQTQRERRALWKKKTAKLWSTSFLRKVPLESRDSVFARLRLVVAALCQIRDARIIAMVGHSVSFLILTHGSKMKNTQILPFVLDCKAKTVAPLLLEDPGKVGRPASTRLPSEEAAWVQLFQKLKQLKGV